MNSKRVQAGLLIITITVLGVIGYNAWLLETTPPERKFSNFITDLNEGLVASVHLRGEEIIGTDTFGREFRTYVPQLESIMPILLNSSITVSAEAPAGTFEKLALLAGIMVILSGIWVLLTRDSGGVIDPGRRSHSR